MHKAVMCKIVPDCVLFCYNLFSWHIKWYAFVFLYDCTNCTKCLDVYVRPMSNVHTSVCCPGRPMITYSGNLGFGFCPLAFGWWAEAKETMSTHNFLFMPSSVLLNNWPHPCSWPQFWWSIIQPSYCLWWWVLHQYHSSNDVHTWVQWYQTWRVMQ